MKYSGFKPVFDGNSKILVLGSFPSVKSRAEGFYYGNRQNRFWKTLSAAFGKEPPTSIEEKRSLLLGCGVALWDIVSRCEIDGSMDANIKDYSVAELRIVLDKTHIEKILCNGAKAYEIFSKNYPELLYMAKKMPSTSPANVRFDEALWRKELNENVG